MSDFEIQLELIKEKIVQSGFDGSEIWVGSHGKPGGPVIILMTQRA